MSNDKDKGPKVTMKPPKADADEWTQEFDGGSPATVIDPDALKKIRMDDSAPDLTDDLLVEAEGSTSKDEKGESAPVAKRQTSELVAIVDSVSDEFDDDSSTVMDPNALEKMGDAGPSLGREPCPKCGVMLAPGHPRCPQCKTSLVVAGTSARRKYAGGTTVVGRTIPWTIVLLSAIATAVIVYLSEREPKIEPLPEDEASDSSQAPTSASPSEAQPEDSVPSVAEPAATPTPVE